MKRNDLAKYLKLLITKTQKRRVSQARPARPDRLRLEPGPTYSIYVLYITSPPVSVASREELTHKGRLAAFVHAGASRLDSSSLRDITLNANSIESPRG